MEQYTTPAQVPQRQTHMGGPEEVRETPAPAEEPSRAELLAAIQGSRVVLEGKIKAVAVEVNLLGADLRKVSDKVKVAEGSIVDLQTEGGAGPGSQGIRRLRPQHFAANREEQRDKKNEDGATELRKRASAEAKDLRSCAPPNRAVPEVRRAKYTAR
ncbi:hypothetical protein NDU88_001656 [Pleurodeles waltl]|uniref:Uncharacterized protein n=1 Tax=Pleurodeles waltl TaxID=8319 RepID=A0AAV7WNB6_PLEWA|nr:hypothetical protein NDU88_001656 [Pleurodeles waltl]